MRSFLLPIICGLLAPTSLIGQWTPLASGLQSIRSITTQGGAIYAATYPTGVRKSIDGGTTWSQVNNGLPLSGTSIFCEAVGRNATHLFAGTHVGIYRSNDGGALWEPANGSLTASNQVHADKFFTFNNVTFAVFTGTVAIGGGIWRTQNSGSTWTIGHSGMGSNVRVYHLTQVGGTLYASTSTGLWTSTDLGLSWSALPGVNYETFALAASGGDLAMASVFGYRYSNDNGSTWNDATGDPAGPTSAEMIAFDGQLIALTGDATGCLRSLDGGMTWTPYNGGFSVIDISSLEEFHADGNMLYAGALFDIYSVQGMGVSISEREEARPRAYPTVNEGVFFLEVPPALAGGRLRVVDIAGRSRDLGLVVEGLQQVSLGSLATGTYLVQVGAGQEWRTAGTVLVQ